MTTLADCPFCVRENADNIKRLGYGASCKPATIDNCLRHKMAIDQYLGSWNGGWYPQGGSIQNMVLNGWGGGGDGMPNSWQLPPLANGAPMPPRKFMCGYCRAVNMPRNNTAQNGLIQYCMACGHNTFGKWVHG